jgi:hypothetical protein
MNTCYTVFTAVRRYDGQIQPTMMTWRNYRSKLNVTVMPRGVVRLTADRSNASIVSPTALTAGYVSESACVTAPTRPC